MNYLKCIKLIQGGKIPIKGQTFDKPTLYKDVNTSKYNIGILAGENNLFIVDIDTKGGGMVAWSEYLTFNFNPYTMQQVTPNGGLHLFFKEKSDKYSDEENKLIQRLKNKTKYRGVGIDIRKGAGFVVAYPSYINDKEGNIKHYSLLNKAEPQEAPLKLLKWLLEKEEEKDIKTNNLLILINNLNDVKALLNKLKDVTSPQWFHITTALKNLIHKYNNINIDELKQLWDIWSKTNKGYNRTNNFKIWESISDNINLNYVINKYLTPDQPLFNFFQPLPELVMPKNINIKLINTNYIYNKNYEGAQFEYEDLVKYKTLIIQSTTGTGKTSNIAKHLKQYLTDNKQDEASLKVLCISNNIALSNQITSSFNNANLNLKSYQDSPDFKADNVSICINSLLKYKNFNEEFFKNCIVYIDEINSFLSYLTHSDTLNSCLNSIYYLLIKIINSCKKLILSDANIMQNVFNFIEERQISLDTSGNNKDNLLLIKNSFRKYEGVPLTIYRNENEFKQKVEAYYSNNDFFSFGSDSKKQAKLYKGDKKARLFSSDEKFKIKDASSEFKDQFIFFSPSIITGVNDDNTTPKTQFGYIQGRTITPPDNFQQMTRTRNLKEVFLFIKKHKPRLPRYINRESIKNEIEREYYKHPKILSLCKINIIDNKFKILDGSFLRLYIETEFLKSIYETNHQAHLLEILKDNKFNISYLGNYEKLNKTTKGQDEEIIKEKLKNEFDIVINNNFNNNKVNSLSTMDDRLKFLNITNETDAEEFKDILQDEHKFNSFLNFSRLQKNKEYIIKKLNIASENLPPFKLITNIYYKIKLIFELEEFLKIERFNIEIDKTSTFENIPIELNKKINSSFRCKETPTNSYEAKIYYVNKLKNLINKLDIIKTDKKQENKKRTQVYLINKPNFEKFIKLNNIFSNPKIKIDENTSNEPNKNDIENPLDVIIQNPLDVI